MHTAGNDTPPVLDPLVKLGVESLRASFGADVPLVRVLNSIAERAVFESLIDGRSVIVKVDTVPHRAQRERQALQIAAEAGLPVPPVLRGDPGPSGILVLGRLDGTQLTETSSPTAWQSAGSVLRRIHGLPTQSLPPFDWKGRDWLDFIQLWADDLLDWLRNAGLMSNAQVDRLHFLVQRGMAAKSEPERVFLHGDCQPFHFLVNPGGNDICGVIDFGDAGSGDALWDIATICRNRRYRSLLLHGYGLDLASNTLLLDAYYGVRQIAAAGWLIENRLDPKPMLTLLEQLIEDG